MTKSEKSGCLFELIFIFVKARDEFLKVGVMITSPIFQIIKFFFKNSKKQIKIQKNK